MLQQETWLKEAVLPPAFIILGNTGDEANDTNTAVSRVTVIANCYLFQKRDGMYDRTLKCKNELYSQERFHEARYVIEERS